MCDVCPGCSSVQLCNISLGNGRFGPTGVDLMHMRRSSKVFPEAVAVASTVLWF